ncbi:MAG TPA: hypothetical protein VKA23_02435 [Mariprofundaceae bacterium]|nr:hypothetical protein [Mariprofundaceae bacterium]
MKVVAKFSRWIGLRVVAMFGIYFMVCLALYRLPASSETEFVEGQVLYQLNESIETNRGFFEEALMQNKILRLKGKGIWYLSKSDHAKLWPEDPIEMYKQGYTMKAKLKVKKLLLGGYADAELVKYDKLSEKPTVWK